METRMNRWDGMAGTGTVQTVDNFGKLRYPMANDNFDAFATDTFHSRVIPTGSMSHTVTITRTTAVSSGSAVYVNSGYLTTTPGLLKLAQLLLGAACVGVVGYYTDHRSYYSPSPKAELFYLLVAVAFLIGTFCLLTSCLVSLSTASIISKTIYEVIYHGLAFILWLAAGLTLIIEVNHYKRSYGKEYEPYLAASIMGLILAVLYLLSTFFANRSYRGI